MKKFIFYLSMIFVGGAIGAYSFLARGGQFANMQTGNLIKLFIGLCDGYKAELVLQCLLPIVGFIFGVIYIKLFQKQKYVAQIALITEFLIICGTAFIPTDFWLNIVASVMLSFCAGLQLQAFNSFEGKFFATIMCTNNMRSVVDLTFDGIANKDKTKLTSAAKVFAMVIAFCLGVAIITLLYGALSNFAILISLPFLVVAFFFIEKTKNNEK